MVLHVAGSTPASHLMNNYKLAEIISKGIRARGYKSKSHRLHQLFGGKWIYDYRCSWWCDDDKRHVSRCSAGVDEFDNEIGPPEYWLYGDGEPKRVYF